MEGCWDCCPYIAIWQGFSRFFIIRGCCLISFAKKQINSTLALIFIGIAGFVFVADADAVMDCYDCHGTRSDADYRPLDDAYRNISTGGFQGNHRTHMNSKATAATCATCHPGSENYSSYHRDGLINVGTRREGLINVVTRINNSAEKTVYGPYSAPRAQSSTPDMHKCSNINCHFEKTTDLWGSSKLPKNGCNKCHEFPPIDGSHGKKHGAYYGNDSSSCTKCHTDHSNESDPLLHAGEAGTRGLRVQFKAFPNTTGHYSGNIAYPDYLPSKNPARDGRCTELYCHSDGLGRRAVITPQWSGQTETKCYSCHLGKTNDENLGKQMNMTSNGHGRLVGPQWIRKYPCSYCHSATVEAIEGTDGKVTDGLIIKGKHVDGQKTIKMANKWSIVGKDAPSYSNGICDNVYCHSDGTDNPKSIRALAWTSPKTRCNTCHGHPLGSCSDAGCHDGRTEKGKYWPIKTDWPTDDKWKEAIPMFESEGPGATRANSHGRHTETDFTCDNCHASTTINGVCTDCHKAGIPLGNFTEVAHLNPEFHVNKSKDVVFRDGGSYDVTNKTCKNTACHISGTPPQWGESVNKTVICLNCHGGKGDVNDFQAFNGTKGQINLTEWQTTGHGRPASAGPYPSSGNPAANFPGPERPELPGNPCWYCHDNNTLHKDAKNPFRLKMHPQFEQRFKKECGYCHMQGLDSECLGCHSAKGSMAKQMTYTSVQIKHDNKVVISGCRAAGCHATDNTLHKTGSPFWSEEQNKDVKNQYLMMGVCLQCHDDDSGGKCTECHVGDKYSLGYDPGPGKIKPKNARATSVHFGYKHYRAFEATGGWEHVPGTDKPKGVWKGGKFCWDCHDPHGDSNIYMVHKNIATTTDGTFGVPITKSIDVSFTKKGSGLDYAKIAAPYNGICNVCHSSASKHFTSVSGDNHNSSRNCVSCHEHRFSDSHADKQSCSDCHYNKPVPRHSGFGLPRDCTKCHGGSIGLRMDVMRQFRTNSHHVQGVEITNKQCYACHWESTENGLIDVRYHEGFNFKNYTSVKNAKVDLVVLGAHKRPTWYNTTTAVQFVASKMGDPSNPVRRAESAKLNNHCLSCHSDQNNGWEPFGDCKTPRQYAWDSQSIAARYNNTGTTTWGKYDPTTYPKANKKGVVIKALSAHGNAVANQGGFDTVNGFDGQSIANTRNGTFNVTCFDCHSSHGSKVGGNTTSYATFNGTKNGGNLKETQAGKGGYSNDYWASSNSNANTVNPYSAGAGQCFDCHLTQTTIEGLTPWGYESSYGASKPIMGYKDTPRFGQGSKGFMDRSPSTLFRTSRKTIVSSHMKASITLNYSTAVQDRIGGLCTPCHDPHGVSPNLGGDQVYAVPLLKGTWMTSPYQEDNPQPDTRAGYYLEPGWRIDRNTFSSDMYNNTSRINETDKQFAGLCMRCHRSLSDGVNKTLPWKSIDRVHESVKGWGVNNEHSFTCSKCHQPHNSGLPRLMQTNCLDLKHRGNLVDDGENFRNRSGYRDNAWLGFPRGGYGGVRDHYTKPDNGLYCHDRTTNSNQLWNNVTPWQ